MNKHKSTAPADAPVIITGRKTVSRPAEDYSQSDKRLKVSIVMMGYCDRV